MNNFELSESSIIESLDILINQCWKILPIFEGKDKKNCISYTREKAYENYQKHLTFLITKVSGASKIYIDNGYYVELVYLLSGMRDFQENEHDRVKYITNHCISLVKKMKEVLVDG